MNAVFLDTVGLLAVWDAADQWHELSRRAFDKLAKERKSFVTTSFVLLECGNAAARRPYRAEVVTLRQTLDERNELIIPTDEDIEFAWDAYARGEAGNAGIVDHVSFSVMRRLGINRAFTNDRHFEAAGFETLF